MIGARDLDIVVSSSNSVMKTDVIAEEFFSIEVTYDDSVVVSGIDIASSSSVVVKNDRLWVFYSTVFIRPGSS